MLKNRSNFWGKDVVRKKISDSLYLFFSEENEKIRNITKKA